MKKLLIIDDNRDILELLTLLFDLEGYEVKALDNGHKLAHTVKEYNPDVILLDVMLGEFDGRELCSEIKKSQDTSHIPIVMISGTHNQKSFSEKDCDADDFVEKPFDIDDLINSVKRQVNAA